MKNLTIEQSIIIARMRKTMEVEPLLPIHLRTLRHLSSGYKCFIIRGNEKRRCAISHAMIRIPTNALIAVYTDVQAVYTTAIPSLGSMQFQFIPRPSSGDGGSS